MFSRASGILVHPTSFPSKYGIGDLGKGAYDFVDFLQKSKQKLWQILPLGPTSFGDSPYQSFSTFAGNPLLISLDILVGEGYLSYDDIGHNDFSHNIVEYGKVIDYKKSIFKIAFNNFLKSKTKEQDKNYKKFCSDNKQWLDDFALFIALKEYFIKERANTFESKEYKTYKKNNEKMLKESQINDYFYGAMWNTWPEDISMYNKKGVEKWTKILSEEIEYYKFLQYEFYRQWCNIKNYANDRDIKIIGDIPIFVSMDSSDVWANPSLYFLNEKGYPTEVAGVPPDYFSATGQLWGNPLYNWAEHKKTGYKWWIDRIKSTLKSVDIVRIDHFRGFESYWSVPYGEETAINGKWIKGPNEDLFKAIEKELGKLPIIAEDLGLITPEVESLRDAFNFPGMKILQFAFDDAEANEYLPHNFTNVNSVIYSGTHDNDTSIGWYNSTTELEKNNFRKYLNVDGSDVSWNLIRLAFSSVSVFAIAPIQDVMNLDSNSRMNTPGVASGNWQFRYTEDMLKEEMAKGLVYLTELFNR